MVSQSSTTQKSKTAQGSDPIGYASVVLATACWGTSALFIKLILSTGSVSPLALAFWRDLTTFVLLVGGIGLLRPDWLRVERRDLRWLTALGSNLGMLHVLWNLSVSLNGAAVATMQQAAAPVIVALVARLLWREPLTGRKMLAMFLTFVGTLLVSGIDDLGRDDFVLSGFVVGLSVPVAYASWNLLGKKVRGRYGPFTVLIYSFGFGALVLLPFQLATPQPWPVAAPTLLWFAGFIGLSTIAGFSIYTFALGRLQASVAAILAMAEIPFVSVYAYALLDERLAGDQLLGGALVIAGVLMLSWRTRRQRARTPVQAGTKRDRIAKRNEKEGG